MDGDCWATCQDYGEHVIAAFRAATGIQEVPRKPEDPYFYEYSQFCREGFRRYLRHYVDALHQYKPDFQVASNWAFSSFMPEPVTADVDFISGDYQMVNSILHGRFEGRFLVHQGKPWDLMDWSFAFNWGDGSGGATKTALQIIQELSVILALGGSVQVYFQQRRDASVPAWQVDIMHEVADFSRARQPFCHQALPVPQIGLFCSTEAFYRKNQRLFSNWGDGPLARISHTLHALVDKQNAVDIVLEHQLLAGRLREYPLIVIPEESLEPALQQELLAYVAQGGNLLLIGPDAVASLADALHLRISTTPDKCQSYLDFAHHYSSVWARTAQVELGARAQPFGQLVAGNGAGEPLQAAGAIIPYGQGKVGAIFFEMADRFATAANALLKNYLQAMVRELFPHPLVDISGAASAVDVVPARKNGKLMINLVNTGGLHRASGVHVYDEVPPIGPLAITIRLGQRPRSIILQPEGQPLYFMYQDGIVYLTLPQLAIYEILEIDEAD